jgi:hypothetical protein
MISYYNLNNYNKNFDNIEKVAIENTSSKE